jgi:ABC-type sugar transport system permease subunit
MVRESLSIIDISGENLGWAGLSNYTALFHEQDLGTVLRNTGIWVVVVVIITMLVSMGLAQLLNERFPGRRLVRWSLLLPWAASLVITTIIWVWMLNYFYGIMNPILQGIGVISHPVDWLGTPGTAFPSEMLVGIIVSIPFTTYVLLAGLQGIPGEVYEAAKVDGASAWRTYRSVTLPQLRPAMLVAVVLNIIYVFNSFTIIWIMTEGGPGHQTDTTATFVYKLAFRDNNIGESAALSVINVVALLIVVGVYVVIYNRRDEYRAWR